MSLKKGVMPCALKVAIMERAVALQLNDHILRHHLDETFQSACEAFHSTETALVRVYNDLLTAIDNNNTVILLLLDLSAIL